MQKVTPNTEECEEGVRDGSNWVELRVCQTCGHVGCCDSSENRHARKHYEETGHPIIKQKENDICYTKSNNRRFSCMINKSIYKNC